MAAAHKLMKGAVCGFLGTFTSRNSDFRGFWLHGQFLPGLEEWAVDLLGPAPCGDGAREYACRLARRRFAEQVNKVGLGLEVVESATLLVSRALELNLWRFVVQVVLDSGREVEHQTSLFVRQHDPGREFRRIRTHWGT